MNAKKMSYEPQLDGLRAAAVFGVLLFHLGVSGVDGGFTGVDVFFVLSGYLISAIIVKDVEAGSFRFGNFYARRIRRLVPAGLVVIILSTAGAFLLMSVEHFESHGRAVVHSTLWVPNINFWLESGYFDADKFTKPLLHFWSLGVEEQFYLFWPLLIFFGLKFGRNMLATVLLALCALSFIAGYVLLDKYPSAVFFLTPFRVWQFGAGALLALVVHKRANLNPRHLPPPIGALACAVGMLAIGFGFWGVSETRYPGLQALIPTFGTLLVIAAGANILSNILLSNQLVRFFGKISYSLYLVHWPVIVFWKYVVNRDFHPLEQVSIGALSILLASVLYYAVETPLRKPWTSNTVSENSNVYARISPFVISAVLLGSYVWAQNGWKWRLPADALNMANQMGSDERLECRKYGVQGFGQACMFGNSGTNADIIVIGDSHASSLANGMHQYLIDNRKTGLLFALKGTIPLKNARTYNNDVKVDRNFDKAIEYALQSDAETIIIHARWALHWTTKRPGKSKGMRKFVGLADSDVPSAASSSRKNFRRALNRTLKELSASNKQIVVVGALPFQGANLAQCATRPTYVLSLSQILASCGGYSRHRAENRAKEVNSVLQSRTAKANVEYVNPIDAFCPKDQSRCLRSVDSEILFRDTNHLSKVGAEFLIDQKLKEFLRK